MRTPARGAGWLVDLGIAAKIRPCLVLSVRPGPADRVLVTLVPPTTSAHGTRFETTVDKRFLRPGAFDAPGLVTRAPAPLARRPGRLETDELAAVAAAVRRWLDL